MANYLLTQTGEEVQVILNQAPETEAGLQQEVTNREQAITAEQQAREQAIAAEATAREQAIAAEATAREQAVSAEATVRADADDALDTKIDAETTRAVAAEGTLTDAINKEVTDRTAAVAAEATARQQADTTLQQAISTEAQARSTADTEILGNLQTEARTRLNADTDLQEHIDDEEERAKAAEATLQANIDTLGQSGGAAVAAERERAEAAEGMLDAKIDAETDRAEAAEGTLNAAIAQEVTDRTAAVSAEATARADADAALQTAINGKQATIADLADIRSGAAAGATAYQKPATGIPATDMSSDVQTSLDKADTALQEHQSLDDYYTKSEVDNLITTPDQEYVSVTATAQTTAVTDLLPSTGAADTLYRVGNWDGTQYDPTMYALFAWNGTTYVCLAVRSFVGEVYDVSVNHPDGQGNPTPYADLTAALGTDGANIPVDIRRGGMSIKFIQGTVQSSDNKYVQYRLMSDTFNTTVINWQGVDNEPTAGSENLVKSGGVSNYIQNANNNVISLEGGTLSWENGYYSYPAGINQGEESAFKRTKKYKKGLEIYISHYEMCGTQTTGKTNNSHVSFWLNDVYVGYLHKGVYKDGHGNVIEPENFEYDSFALNAYTDSGYDIDYLTYYVLANLSQKADIDDTKFISGEFVKDIGIDNEPTADSGNLVKSSKVYALGQEVNGVKTDIKTLADKLIWHIGTFYDLNTGLIKEPAIYTYACSDILPIEFEPLISHIEMVGTQTDGITRNSHKSLYLNGTYVGYLRAGSYYTPQKEPVSSIEYNYFAINEYNDNWYNPSYETYYVIFSLAKAKEEGEEEGKISFDKSFYALGDSTTFGAGSTTGNTSWADILTTLADFISFTKLAANGAFCMYHPNYARLSTQVNSVPSNYAGIITIMIGTNDFMQDSPLGDSSVTMNKAYGALTDTDNFADSFRYNLETLKRKCPDAIILCITPLPSRDEGNEHGHWDETNLFAIRQIERDICNAMGIPLIESAKEFGLSRYVYDWYHFYSDFVHPNNLGYERIAHCMLGKFIEYCQ